MRIAHDGNLRWLKQGVRAWSKQGVRAWLKLGVRAWLKQGVRECVSACVLACLEHACALSDLQLRGDERGERVVEEHDVAVAEQHVVAGLQRDCELPTAQSPPPTILVFSIILACSTRISSRGFLRTMALNSSLPNALCAKDYNWNTVANKDTCLLRVERSPSGALPWSPWLWACSCTSAM